MTVFNLTFILSLPLPSTDAILWYNQISSVVPNVKQVKNKQSGDSYHNKINNTNSFQLKSTLKFCIN